MALDHLLEQEFIQVTEQAAIASARTMGRGDRRHSDQVAVEAMRKEMDNLPMDGRIVIGEGERDKAPLLYTGEEVGKLRGQDGATAVDIAVDPLEGTNLCATGAPDAIAVLAASERGGLLYAPDVYMDKIVVGPTARGSVHIDAPVAENLRNIAAAFGRQVKDLTIVVLDRDRHQQLVEDIRQAGARIRLIGDGDLSAGISAAVRGTGVHAVMGIGGAPEGVITAAAMRCLGGEIQARLKATNDEQAARLKELGFEDVNKIYKTEDLAPGEEILFSASGVTDGELLRGVRFFGGGSRTTTLFMSLSRKIIRFVDTIHREQVTTPVRFI
ncbi:MAG: fructose,6-bisphosphatase / sedoheptulose,7-bisphosphatase [Acidobacteriota bacterium]|jgi:fructose-1,6-bisphosphatase class II|nr:fructose,6-bisphosphatase / sedoheptulose,7-bisphosphatase [Acidobacteriota bacterium]